MPVAANRGLPGGQRNVKRAMRVRRVAAPPPNFPRYVPKRVGQVPRAKPARAPRPTRAPVSDVQSSGGGDYGLRKARRYARTPQYHRVLRQAYKAAPVAQRKKVLANAPKGSAVRKQAESVHKLRAQHYKLQAPGRYYASLGKSVEKVANEQRRQALEKTITVKTRSGATIKVPKVLYAKKPDLQRAGFVPPGLADKIAALGPTAAAHAPKDVFDLAITTPSSIAKIGSEAGSGVVESVKKGSPKPALKAGERIGKELAQPYKEFFKDPVKFAGDRPVTTFLMFDPAIKAPVRVAGRAARIGVLGKTAKTAQSLERPAATLPGTTLKQVRTGSRSVVRRAKQAKEDKAIAASGRGPAISLDELHRRVDEFHDASRHWRRRQETSVAKRARKEAKDQGMSRKDAKEHIQAKVADAVAGQHHEINARFVREFGSHLKLQEKTGNVHTPKGAEHGHIHESHADATKVAKHLSKRMPYNARVVDAGYGKFGVVPERVADRLDAHMGIGKSKALGARALRAGLSTFRGAVLPLSGKWLTGQAVEAAFRSAVKGAGPTSWYRAHRIIRQMERDNPGSGIDFMERAVAGGQFGASSVLRDFATGKKTMADEFAGSEWEKGAEKVTKAGKAPVVKQARQGWHLYQSMTMGVVNGFFESSARKAILGKSIRQSHLMDHKLITLSDKAIKDAANGLRGTHNQVELARQVDRAYGKYAKYSPAAREALAHWTPFLPWYKNMVDFLVKTLPQEHPIKAALLADVDKATEEWRKAHGLSFHAGKREPAFLQGTYPLKGGGHRAVGRFLPFLPAEPASALGGLVAPQYAGALLNLAGVDWKGDPIRPGHLGETGSRLANAGATLAEAHIPGVSLLGKATGVIPRYVEGKDVSALGHGLSVKDVPGNIKRAYLPTTPIKAKPKKKKSKSGGGGSSILKGSGGGGILKSSGGGGVLR